MFKFPKLFTISLLGFLLLLLVATTPKTEAARTDDVWQERLGSYLETAWNEGRNILINGSNKYLNFGIFSGSSGYGIRDNAGTIECKNDGGSWGPCQDGTGGGGSGGGGLATTTPWTNGNLAYVTGLGTVGSVATGTLTETVTGLQFDQTRGLVGGAAILSLTSGYDIPLSASTTQWSGFYNTPSTKITAGSRLSWSGNTLSAALQISTSSSNGALAFWTGTSALGSVATGTLTETVTGLELSATRGLVGGAAVLALTSGYNIPLTASTTEWTNFYNTPSTRITAGTGIDWSGNTLNGVYTAGDGLTLTGEDFDFDGGASPGGALGGTWASPTVDDDGHNHTGATLSGIDISSDTNLSADGVEIILTGDALSLGTEISVTNSTSTASFFSALGTFTNTVINTLLTAAAATFTGLVDIGAGVLEIPNGTAPTVDSIGEVAVDTTGDQLLVGDTSGNARVVQIEDVKIWSVTIASTSDAFLSSGLVPVPTQLDGYTITRIQCHVTGGTSKVVAVEDASANSSEDITCATTNTTDDGSITNATYTANELSYIDFGATTGSVNYVTISVFGNWTRE